MLALLPLHLLLLRLRLLLQVIESVGQDLEQGVEKITSVASPVDFGGRAAQPAGPVPPVGAHTAEVLQEFGVDRETARRLHEAGVKKGTHSRM